MPSFWPWGGPGAESNVGEATALSEEFLDDYALVYLREIIKHNGRALCLIPPDFLPNEAHSVAGGTEWPQLR